jgi:hypothetical protein
MDENVLRGMVIEPIHMPRENTIISSIIQFTETLVKPIQYDSIYKYDKANPVSSDIHYDKGLIIVDSEFMPIDLVAFKVMYDANISTLGLEATIALLMTEFDITYATCTNIISQL